jgi:hypothetical protein
MEPNIESFSKKQYFVFFEGYLGWGEILRLTEL